MNKQAYYQGFIARAKQYGIPTRNAQELFKQADVGGYFGNIGQNINDTMHLTGAHMANNFVNHSIDAIKGGTHGSFNPLNWGGFGDAYHQSHQNSLDGIAGAQAVQYQHAADQGNSAGGLAARNEMLSTVNQLDDPNRIAQRGNQALSTDNQIQQGLNTAAQSQYNINHAHDSINAMQGSKPAVAPTLASTAQHRVQPVFQANKPTYGAMSGPTAPTLDHPVAPTPPGMRPPRAPAGMHPPIPSQRI